MRSARKIAFGTPAGSCGKSVTLPLRLLGSGAVIVTRVVMSGEAGDGWARATLRMELHSSLEPSASMIAVASTCT
jgi:hypothetical protein